MYLQVKIYQIFLFYCIIIVYYFKQFKDLTRKSVINHNYNTNDNVLKENITVKYTDKKTNLKSYCEPLKPNFLENIYMDVTQGSGYDYILEENAKISKWFWLGNNERSITHDKSLEILIPFLNGKNDIKILDIGCGSGTTIIRLDKFLKSKNINYTIYGCDIYSNIVVECIHNIKNTDINVNLLLCNGEDLPYKDNYFDLVINFGSINQFNDIQKGLNEMIRVVNPNGMCICRDEHYNEKSLTSFEKIYFSFMKDQVIPYNLLPENHSYQVVNLNKIHFLLVF